MRISLVVCLTISITAGSRAAEWENGAPPWPPSVPVGQDAYRLWELWPQQRIGVRAYMRSTHDRDGLNRTADASHFLYAEAPHFNVSLDVLGTGVLYFVRTNHWHGSPWHYEIDGIDHLVRETSTDNPTSPAPNSVLEPAEVFPRPLTWAWPVTMGSDLNWVPMPFARSLRVAYSRTHYGTGYYIYHLFAPGVPLSRDLEPFDFNSPVDSSVLELIDRSGTDIAPQDIPRDASDWLLRPGHPLEIFSLQGAATIRALKITVPEQQALEVSNTRLRIFWDNRSEASVDAPLSLFFGAGLLYNRSNTEYLVKAFPVSIRYRGSKVHLSAYFPMPFFQSARIELVPPVGLPRPVPIHAEIRYEVLRGRPSDLSYFHATYYDHGAGEPGRDLVLLDTRGLEGSEVWSGAFIGTSFTFTDRAELRTLEGDPRFFFDDARAPQGQGTGTEEWAGGGDYWGGRTMTLPFVGHPTGAPSAALALDSNDLVHSAYRFLLADLFLFGRNARIHLEHGGENEMAEAYRTVTYWYGLPAATLVKTDELEVGDPSSEQAHAYFSPDASVPYDLTSRYDLGPDTTRGPHGPVVIHPAETQRVRYTRGSTEFRMTVHPDNGGVLLRRTLDYALPDQRATVEIAVDDGAALWEVAGTWYSAGSTTYYHSFPPGELDAPDPVILTTDRRFREEEFLVPLHLTRGRKAIRIRLTFQPVERPVLPGLLPVASAWSEIRYQVYSWIRAPFERPMRQ